jgi:hypothetical protein
VVPADWVFWFLWKPSDKSELLNTILLSRAVGRVSGIVREYVRPSYGHPVFGKKIKTLVGSFML